MQAVGLTLPGNWKRELISGDFSRKGSTKKKGGANISEARVNHGRDSEEYAK